MAVQLVTAAASDPITVAQAKSHSRISTSDDDTILGLYITAATEKFQAWTSMQLVNATFDEFLDSFAILEEEGLQWSPVSSVTSIKYIDTDGNEQTVTSTIYQTDLVSKPSRIVEAYNQSWPSFRNQLNTITVRHVAGFGADATSVPEDIKYALKLIVAGMYEQREEDIAGTIISSMPEDFGVSDIVRKYRNRWF